MGEDWGRNAAILQATIDGTEYTDPPQSRIEALLLELKAVIEAGGGGGGTTNYNGLSNKPQINNVTLQGNLSTSDLGILIPPGDSELSGTSENWLQNRIIKGALDGKQDTLTFDNAPTAESDNPVKSGGVKTALDAKQDTLTFDNAPTADSNNPVKSGGIKTALDAKQDTLTFDNFPTANSNNPVKSGGLFTVLANCLYGSIQTLEDSDINNVNNLFFIADNCTNSPFTMAYGVYLSFGDNAAIEIVADIETGEIKTRTKNSSGWTSWKGANSIIYG